MRTSPRQSWSCRHRMTVVFLQESSETQFGSYRNSPGYSRNALPPLISSMLRSLWLSAIVQTRLFEKASLRASAFGSPKSWQFSYISPFWQTRRLRTTDLFEAPCPRFNTRIWPSRPLSSALLSSLSIEAASYFRMMCIELNLSLSQLMLLKDIP